MTIHSSAKNAAKRPRIFISLILLTGIILFYFLNRLIGHGNPISRNTDVQKLSHEQADILIMGMDSPDYLPGDLIAFYTGENVLTTEHHFASFADIADYLDLAVQKSPSLSCVYLELNPFLLSDKAFGRAGLYSRLYEGSLGKFFANHADMNFQIFLASPSLEAWKKLSDDEQDNYLENFTNIVNMLSGRENVHMTWLGDQKWLIANPSNYQELNSLTAASLSPTDTLSGMIMGSTTYEINLDLVADRIALLRNLISTEASPTASLKTDEKGSYTIYFLGDSVIGNYTDSLSIPGVVSGLTGAKCINLGIGGSSAAFTTSSGEKNSPASLMEVLDKLLAGEYGEVVTQGADYSRTCFVLNYGLNDFFQGNPLYDIPGNEAADSPLIDKYGNRIGCFAGALETAIYMLQNSYPECSILLMGSNFTVEFDNGQTPQGPMSGVLTDYVDATREVAEQMGVLFLSSYDSLGANEVTYPAYLEDGTHPNVYSRFVLGEIISRMITTALKEGE